MTQDLYIGLMTGTSLDAVDAAIVDFSGAKPQLIGTHNHDVPADLKAEIRQLCLPGHNEIDLMGEVSVKLGELYATAVAELLANHQVNAADIRAIGSHGQTIRHRPNAKHPFTLQIGDPNVISARTGITTIADFRRKDMAHGGQGAPLAPAFHHALLADRQEAHWILNIGGIANLTYLDADTTQPVIGFDTGPGNTLMDQWYQQHHQAHFDRDGAWAASGQADQALLQTLLTEPYFNRPVPKSTGRELFNLDWLSQFIRQTGQLKPEDVQATLLELSVQSIADGLLTQNKNAKHLWLCGGGTHNKQLCKRLAERLPNLQIAPCTPLGIEPDWMEAAAFAWLAKQTQQGMTGNIASVTGATRDCVLGTICPA